MAYLMMPDNLEAQMFIFTMLIGMAAGSTGSNSAIFSVFLTYILSVFTPLIIVFLSYDGKIYHIFSAVSIFYIVIISLTAKRISKNLDDSLRLKEELKETIIKEQEANKSKDIFLSSMSHEIRTPLNAILGYINILDKNETDQDKKEKMGIIKSSSNQLLGVINDILDFNKISTSKITLESIDINFYDELSNLSKLYEGVCREKGLDFILFIDEDVPQYIKSDLLRLNQILNNLISNAIKFSKDSVNIVLSVSKKDNKIYFSVKDSGVGISKEAQERIFDEFGQADNSISRKYGGSGLGLSISSKLVKLFGSKLEVKSTLGEGSEFYFDIEYVESTKQDDEIVENIFTFNNQKILIAEDNKTNQMLVKMLLEDYELELEFADDGKIAVEKYNSSIDLVLMDINMPNKNGIEAMKEIKQNFKDAKIVALTANALSTDKQKYLNDGFDGYISKPIDEDELLKTLKELL